MIKSNITMKLDPQGRLFQTIKRFGEAKGCTTTANVIRTMITDLPEFKETEQESINQSADDAA